MTYNFHPSILRAYDVRGIYNETLSNMDAFFIGRGFASLLLKNSRQNSKQKITVGCDGRASSPELKRELIEGLVKSGIEVIDIGLVATPMLYFSIYHLDCDAGIMITGSHNPKDYNGFKMALKSRPFFGDDITELANLVRNGVFVDGEGSCSHKNIDDAYVERVMEDCILAHSNSELLDEVDEVTPCKNLKIAWDVGNGAAGVVIKKITSSISAKHFVLFEEVDGNFPNHHPDPTEEKNLQDLICLVKSSKSDIGIAFDGDADRIGVIDDEGQIIWGDQLMTIYARDILSYDRGATFIADVKASSVFFDEVKRCGGEAIMWKTGHSLIKSKMKEVGAVLAGEMSGHIFFADKYYGFDDAIYAAIRIINIVAKSGVSLSQIRKSLPKTFNTPEIKIECDDDKKFDAIDKIKSLLSANGVDFNSVDGVRVSNRFGWWLLRASNTQPALVARCEAHHCEEGLAKLKEELNSYIFVALGKK